MGEWSRYFGQMGFEIFKASYIKRLLLASFLWVGGCGGTHSGALEIGETVQHAAESVLVEIDI